MGFAIELNSDAVCLWNFCSTSLDWPRISGILVFWLRFLAVSKDNCGQLEPVGWVCYFWECISTVSLEFIAESLLFR